MQVKRIVPLVLALMLLLAGCGSGGTNKTKVGVFFAAYEQTPQQEALLEGLSEAGFLGVPLDAKGDSTLQKTQLEGLLGQEYPLVIVEPVEKPEELATMAKIAQTPCIFIGNEPEDQVLESWDKLCYVGVDDSQQASLQGKLLLSCPYGGDINGDGVITYAIIRGPEGDPQADFLAKNCDVELRKSLLPIKLLDTRVSDGTQESGQQQAQELLTKYGKDIEAILCNSDTLAMGAAQAVIAGGWTEGKDLYVLGIGGEEAMLRLISEGKCTGTVAQDAQSLAGLVAQAAKGLLENDPVEKRYYGGYLTVTRENISIFYKENANDEVA